MAPFVEEFVLGMEVNSFRVCSDIPLGRGATTLAVLARPEDDGGLDNGIVRDWAFASGIEDGVGKGGKGGDSRLGVKRDGSTFTGRFSGRLASSFSSSRAPRPEGVLLCLTTSKFPSSPGCGCESARLVVGSERASTGA